MTRSNKKQLLAGTSALALTAAAAMISTPAYAAFNVTPVTTTSAVQETAGANSDTLAITDGGNITYVAGDSVVAATKTGLTVNVTETTNTALGINNTADFSAITTSAGAGTYSAITITGGTVASAKTGANAGVIQLDSTAAQTTTITLANSSSAITNTNTGATGNAIFFDNGTAAGTLTVTNTGGTISTTKSGQEVIKVGATKAQVANITNTGGNILATAVTDKAIDITAGGGIATLSQTGAAAVIRGTVTLGDNAGSTFAVSGGTVNGAITLGDTGQVLTLGGGQVNGAIAGTGANKGQVLVSQGSTSGAASATYVSNGNFSNLTSVTIADGKTLNAATNNNTIGASAVVVGNGGAGTAVLTLGTGAVSGTIDGDGAGKGTVNFNGSNTLAAAVGNGAKLAAINVAGGTTLTTGGNIVKATQINVGTGSTAGTLTVGTGAITGLIDSTSAGTGTINFTGANTLGVGTNIGSVTGFGTINVTDGIKVRADTNNNTIKATNVVLGTSTGVNSELDLGTGTLAGTINAKVAGQGILKFVGNNTTNGNIGSTAKLASVIISDNKTVNLSTNNNALSANAITLGDAVTTSATLIVGTGQLTGVINGDTAGNGIVTFAGNQTLATGTTIGAATGIATVNINDGVTLSDLTNVIKATNVTVGSTTGVGSVLTLGTGVVTGAIDAKVAGVGIVNLTDTQSLGGAVGGTTKLAAINISDGKTITNGDANIGATNIKIGTSTAGATLITGTGNIVGSVDSAAAGTGTLRVTDAKTATLGAASNIGSNSSLASVIVGDGSTLTAAANNDSIKATTVQLGRTAGGVGTLSLGTGAVTGAITTFTNNKGVLNIGGTQSLGGNVGASGLALNQINVTAGTTTVGTNTIYATKGVVTGGATVALNTGVFNGDIDGVGANAGLVTFAGKQTTAGAIGDIAAGGGNGLASITFGNGSNVTLGALAADIVHATAINVATGGRLNFGTVARTTNAGDITTAGTAILDLGTQSQTLLAGNGAGNLTTAAGGQTIRVGIRSGTNDENGKLAIDGTAVIDASTLLVADTSAASGYIATGKTYQYLSAGTANASAVLAAGNVSSTSPLFTATESTVPGAAGTRTITLTRVAGGYNGVATTGDTKAAGTVLEALGVAGTADAKIAPFLGIIDQQTSAAGVTNTINSAIPQVQQNSIQAVQSTQQSLDVVGTRLGQLRAGIDSSVTGMSAGGRVADKGIWIQAFGTTADQDTRSGVFGYDADTAGAAVGGDIALNDNTRLGLSVSYAHTNVDGNAATASSNDIDSYQGTAYGTHNMGNWYTDGMLGFAWHSYDSDRSVTGVGVANGDYDGQTYSGRVGGGYHFLTNSGFDITPNASLSYFYNNTEGYTESGVGGLNNRVSSSDSQALYGRLGADVGYSFNYSSMLVRPVIRAAYMYDFVGDQLETTSQFTGGGATFKVRDASPERNSFDLGASLNIARSDNISFSADYDYTGRTDYSAHSGMLRARYNF